MKKTYVKPFASFESFELSANIAGVCVVATNHSKTTCHSDPIKEAEGMTVFATYGICDIVPVDENDDKYCYQGALSNLFAS